MEEGSSGGLVKHVLIAKFKQDLQPHEIEELIKGYANLVSLIPPMKAFHWGTDVGVCNMDEGFTHIFESEFESSEGVAEYMAHPAHAEFADLFLPQLDKVVVIDYKPALVRL